MFEYQGWWVCLCVYVSVLKMTVSVWRMGQYNKVCGESAHGLKFSEGLEDNRLVDAASSI